MPICPPRDQSTGSDTTSRRCWFLSPPNPEIDAGHRAINVTLLIQLRPVTGRSR